MGEFNATDPEGGAITFILPEGENNNSLFTIDANGTLRSATIFDYENDPSTFTITVQAKDDYNISVEGNFTITLIDEDEVVYNPTTLDGALYTASNAGASEVLVVGPSNADFHITQTPTIPSDLNVTFLARGNLFVDAAVSFGASQSITLFAGQNIYLNQEVSGSGKLHLYAGQAASDYNNSYNYFVRHPVNLAAGNNLFVKIGGDGTVEEYTVIRELGASGSNTGTDLQGMQQDLTRNYALGSDINASSTSGWNSGKGFFPVGGQGNGYAGNFDGLGHVIHGLFVDRTSSTDYASALFGYTDGATLRNVGFEDVWVRGNHGTGALVGRFYGGGLIEFCYARGVAKASGIEDLGGLIGKAKDGAIIRNCFTDVEVTGTNTYDTGGLIGEMQSSPVLEQSYSVGKVSNNASRTGGLSSGYSGNKLVYDSFWNVTTSGMSSSPGKQWGKLPWR